MKSLLQLIHISADDWICFHFQFNMFIVIKLHLTTILLNFSVFFFFNFSLLDSDPGRKMNAPCESGSTAVLKIIEHQGKNKTI